MNEEEEFEAWLQQGVDRGWVSEPVCSIHGTLPTTEWEDHEFDNGYDPCLWVLRVWEDE